MDPLSLAAGVIAVIQVAGQIIKICKKYTEGIQDAPADLRAMHAEISTLKTLFDSLNDAISTLANPKDAHALQASVNECHRILQELEKHLLTDEGTRKVKPTGLRATMATLMEAGAFLWTHKKSRDTASTSRMVLWWPLKKERAENMLKQLVSHKHTINLFLTKDTTTEVKEIKATVKTIEATLSRLQVRQPNVMFQLMMPKDLLSTHSSTFHLHESGTCDWVFRTNEWNKWLEGTDKLIWIYGIPGAGKTVLASYLIETLSTKLSQASSDKSVRPDGVAFHYCSHSRSREDERLNMLKSIISQLCQQANYTPSKLTRPRGVNTNMMGDLWGLFDDVASCFERINIVIDALDEPGNRAEFLTCVLAFQGRARVHVLATSRDEIDIRRSLEPLALSVSMSNPVVDEDIRTHVHAKLHSDPKFLRWPLELLDELEDALIVGAKGMFRWAHCQLCILRRLNQQRAVRKALRELPETLDETYERILCSIPDESRPLAFRALAILCSNHSSHRWTAELIRDAVLWGDPSCEDSDLDDEIFDIDALHEVCVCLTKIEPDLTSESIHQPTALTPETFLSMRWSYRGRRILLAHYTVKEFLMSDRIASSPAHYLTLSQARANLEEIRPVLTAILHSTRNQNELQQTPRRPFTEFAFYRLPYYFCIADRDFAADRSCLKTIHDLLNPENKSFLTVSETWKAYGGLRAWKYGLPVSTITSRENKSHNHDRRVRGVIAARMVALQLEHCFMAYLGQQNGANTKAILQSRFTFDCFHDCTILDIAATAGLVELCDYLFAKGADINDSPNVLIHACAYAPGVDSQSIVSYLLKKGTNPNARWGPFTPLNLAVRNGHLAAVTALVEAGAKADDQEQPERRWEALEHNYSSTNIMTLMRMWEANSSIMTSRTPGARVFKEANEKEKEVIKQILGKEVGRVFIF
ncbi:hypothetical protein QBC44DRAFT_95226 [Cladorrhinum sp. PSN332]|nr:hypothetical protein QBC44DRAFT_95226 [Cladorrhinum sp. PSN332]